MIKISEILDYLIEQNIEYKFSGNKEANISDFSSITNIKDNSVTWLRSYNEKLVKEIFNHNGVLLITTPEIFENINCCDCLFVDKPKMVFFEIVKHFFCLSNEHHISETAVVKSKSIGKNVSIGHFCYIGQDVEIGDNTIIKNNVVIECPTTIGKNCNIGSGVIIGSDGFGYYLDRSFNNAAVPHFGGVKIGDYVDIGANTCIDRGTIENTIIDDFSKIDNLCHIAHNVKIGKNVFVIASSMIGGSATLDDNAYIAPGVKVMNQIHVGKSSFVGMGAVVTKDVEDDMVVAGVPAKAIRKREETDRE